MGNTSYRRVRKDYWYTSAQIIDVGTAWAQSSRDRIFLYSNREVPNRTSLETSDAPPLYSLPKKMLLPLNKGKNHWAAIAITLNEGPDNAININISYTDSLNTKANLNQLDSSIRDEINRIEKVFRTKYSYKQLNIVSSVYPYSWQQAEGSSCGPYSLANAMRCLDGKGAQNNPGAQAIREQQLNMMTNQVAIKGCSTSNIIDTILLEWILEHARQSLAVTTAEQVESICNYYATKHQLKLSDVIACFHEEYCSGTMNPWFRPDRVNTRVRELIGEYAIKPAYSNALNVYNRFNNSKGRNYGNSASLRSDEWKSKFQSDEAIQRQVVSIREENLCRKIDDIRKILVHTGQDSGFILELMEQIVRAIQKVNEDEAKMLVKEVLSSESQKVDCELCQRLISEIIGARRYDRENNEKFVYLASAYQSLADAIKMLKEVEFTDLTLPEQVLEAHLTLLNGAIARNTASAIRQVSFVINDFFSMLLEYLSGGYWVAEITRIEHISKSFKDPEGNLSIAMLEQEQQSIATILSVRQILENDDLVDNNNRLMGA